MDHKEFIAVKLIRQFKLFFLFGVIVIIQTQAYWQNLPIRPELIFLPFYHWGIIRRYPSCLFHIFVWGFVMDAFYGTPIGSTSLLFILSYLALSAPQTFLKRDVFIIQWFRFLIYMLLYLLFKAIYYYFVLDIPVNFPRELISIFLNLCLYPLFVPLLNRLENIFKTT